MSSATRRGRRARASHGCQSGVRASRPPRYRRSASGMRHRAISLLVILQDHDDGPRHGAQRPVQGGDGGSAGVESRSNVEPPRLEIGAVRRRGDLTITILAGCPAICRSYLRAALKPRSPAASSSTWKGIARALTKSFSPLQQASGALSGILPARRRRTSRPCRTNATRKMPRVSLPWEPASAAIAGAEADIAAGQRIRIEDLVGVVGRKRNLCRADQVKIILLRGGRRPGRPGRGSRCPPWRAA